MSLVTIFIYYGRKRQNLSNAVAILSLQIRDIEDNIGIRDYKEFIEALNMLILNEKSKISIEL